MGSLSVNQVRDVFSVSKNYVASRGGLAWSVLKTCVYTRFFWAHAVIDRCSHPAACSYLLATIGSLHCQKWLT